MVYVKRRESIYAEKPYVTAVLVRLSSAIHIEIIGLDVIRRKFDDSADKMVEILKRFKHFNNDLFCNDITIEIVTDTGREFIE